MNLKYCTIVILYDMDTNSKVYKSSVLYFELRKVLDSIVSLNWNNLELYSRSHRNASKVVYGVVPSNYTNTD